MPKPSKCTYVWNVFSLFLLINYHFVENFGQKSLKNHFLAIFCEKKMSKFSKIRNNQKGAKTSPDTVLRLLWQLKKKKKKRKGILQVPDTGTSQYWWILEHFWCTSIAWKCDIHNSRSLEHSGVIQKLTTLERKKWSSIVQYSCTSIWDLKYTLKKKKKKKKKSLVQKYIHFFLSLSKKKKKKEKKKNGLGKSISCDYGS